MPEELEEHNLLIQHLENIADANRLPSNVVESYELTNTITNHAGLPNAHHPQEHTHATHGGINFTGTISANGQLGLTGARTIDGHTLTFKNGILVGYQAP